MAHTEQMSLTRMKRHVQLCDDALRELALTNIRQRAQIEYTIEITRIDRETKEPVADTDIVVHGISLPLHLKQKATIRVSDGREVQRTVKRSPEVSFRIELIMKLNAPREHCKAFVASSGRLDALAWNEEIFFVVNPFKDGEDWQVHLSFDDESNELQRITIKHDPDHCQYIVDQLTAEALVFEQERLANLVGVSQHFTPNLSHDSPRTPPQQTTSIAAAAVYTPRDGLAQQNGHDAEEEQRYKRPRHLEFATPVKEVGTNE